MGHEVDPANGRRRLLIAQVAARLALLLRVAIGAATVIPSSNRAELCEVFELLPLVPEEG